MITTFLNSQFPSFWKSLEKPEQRRNQSLMYWSHRQGFCVCDVHVLVHVHMYKRVLVHGGQRLMLSVVLHYSVNLSLEAWPLM